MVFQVKDIVQSDPKTGEDVQLSIPCLQVENKSYEEDQEQEKHHLLPVSQDLVFIRYDLKGDEDNAGTRGYVFFYPSEDKTSASNLQSPTTSK